jgi:hypothetical protein
LKSSRAAINLQFSTDELEGSMTATTTGPATSTSRTRPVLAVTCLALATVVAAVASLNVAIPSIARDTHASSTQLSWMVDA